MGNQETGGDDNAMAVQDGRHLPDADAEILKEQTILNGLLFTGERTDNDWSCLVFRKD